MAGVSPLPEGWPTLSQLKAADFSYLGQFADYCDHISGKAEKALDELAQEVRRPGGVEWEGAAGEAAVNQAEMDIVKARPFLWGAPDAAAIARRGQDTLEAGTRLALDAVDDAGRAGFQVQESYRAVDTHQATTREQLAERQAEAEAHSNYIRHRVAALAANEQHVTNELKTATAGWGKLTFEESPAGTNDTIVGNGDGHIRPVDRTWKQGPDQPPWQPPPPPYPQGPPVGPGLPPEGVRPPVDGPLTVGPASKPSLAAKGEQHLWDKNGGEWRYDPGQDRWHYPHWDYNPHTAPNSRWDNVGIDGLPTHREGAAPPRSGTVGTPPGAPGENAPPEPAPTPAAPRVEPPPAAPPARPAPVERLPPLPPPTIIGGPGGVTGGGGGPGVPGLGSGGIHHPTGEVE